MSQRLVTAPKFDGNEGTVYKVINTDKPLKVSSIIEDTKTAQRYAVPSSWLVDYVEPPAD